MSELLRLYQQAIDKSDFDKKNAQNEIRALSNEFVKKMKLKGDIIGLKHLQLEKDLHEITKSITLGLIPTAEQTRTSEDGKVIRVMWPDFNVYGELEYDYFQQRYNSTANIFLRTEYGLMLFLNNKLNRNDQKLTLCTHLTDLLKSYKTKILSSNEEWDIYSHVFHDRIIDTLTILSRAGNPLKTELESFVKLIERWFLDWPVDNKAFTSFSQLVAHSLIDFKKQIQSIIDPDKIIAKLNEAAKQFQTVDRRSAIAILEKTINFCNTYKPSDKDRYFPQLANLYEEEGDFYANDDNISSIKDYEDSIKYFHAAKDSVGIARVSKKYEANKGKFKLATFKVETNEEESKIITDFIDLIANSGSPSLIIASLSGHRIFKTASNLKSAAEKAANSNSLLNFCTSQSLDKFGNTLKVYITKEERLDYHLSRILYTSHQFGAQTVFQILFKSLKNKAVSYEIIRDELKKSWLNDPVEWLMYGELHAVIPLNAILPGIENFFSELEHRIMDVSYQPNFILCSDSMATKIEMILRYMCKNMNIPTFQYKEDRGHLLTDEKPLSKLLENLEGVLHENEIVNIRYLINEKGGLNIRNQIAHGLLDSDEYSPIIPITLFAIILRLSHYKLINKPSN